MRVIFFGSPPFATPVFERLARSVHRPLALVTAPDRPRGRGLEILKSKLVLAAESTGIEALQPSDVHAPEVLERLRALAPDVLLVASYGVILKPALLELAPQGALNVHASLLPRHRGASPIQSAILACDPVTGISIQRMVRALDEGDVLLTKEHEIGWDDTAGDLLVALSALGGEAAVEALDLLASGRAVFTPQEPAHATYARKLTKAHGVIDWSRNAVMLARFVRAMTPWPGARCLDPQARELLVLRAAYAGEFDDPAGTVIEAGPRFIVSTSQGGLELQQLVPAGKRAMSGAEYVRGARIQVGERMSSPRGA